MSLITAYSPIPVLSWEPVKVWARMAIPTKKTWVIGVEVYMPSPLPVPVKRSGRTPLPYDDTTICSLAERPDLDQLPRLWLVHVSPAFRRSQSGYPERRRALPAEIVALGVAALRPLFESLPPDELT